MGGPFSGTLHGEERERYLDWVLKFIPPRTRRPPRLSFGFLLRGYDQSGCRVHNLSEYTAGVPEISLGKSVLMAVESIEQVAQKVPADDFQALEAKVYRTIELYKSARQAQATAERDAERLRQQMEDREEELVRLRREAVQLKKEREDIRGRVERMLEQIETIAEAS